MSLVEFIYNTGEIMLCDLRLHLFIVEFIHIIREKLAMSKSV